VANTITAMVPKVLARGLMVLREQSIMPRLVQSYSDTAAANKGDVITIPVADAGTARSVTPAVTQAANQDRAPTKQTITLDQWKESTFHITDKQLEEMDADTSFVPLSVSGSIKALANGIDDYILGLYTGIYSHSGVPGTTPFATSLNEFRDARKRMNQEAAPMEDRVIVLGSDAEANALNLSNFLQAEQRGDQGGVVRGELGRLVGSTWYLDQRIDASGNQHTAGTWAITGTGYNEVKAAVTAGVSTIIVQGNSSTTTNGGTLVVGDVFRVNGDSSQQYVVKTAASIAVGAQKTLSVNFAPALRVGVAAGATLEFESASGAGGDAPTDHEVNLMFHPQAFGFASRTLADSTGRSGSLGSVFSTAVDPISGVALRLEVNRQYKQTTWAFDCLYGATLIRPELACRIMG